MTSNQTNTRKVSVIGIVPILSLLAMVVTLAGCGSSRASALVGRWAIEEGQPNSGVPDNMELLKDGTGIVDGQGITWKTESGRFYLIHPLQAEAWSYKKSGSILTLTNGNGRSVKYKKDDGKSIKNIDSVEVIPKVIMLNEGPLSAKEQRNPLREGVWLVVHVTDGDTLDVQDDEEVKHRIRLIGTNAPEVVKPNHPVEPFGPEAVAFTKKAIADSNNRVRVVFDGDQIDRYGRNLAMIYLQTADGEVLLNELLIRAGLARAQTQYRYSKAMKQRFQAAENAAKAERRNIWSEK